MQSKETSATGCVPARSPEAPALSLQGSSFERELAAFAKAVGHPARVRIIRMLAERSECVCGDIVEEIGLAQSTVSQHLKVLRAVGLIQGEIDGPRVCYCLNRVNQQRFKILVAAL